MNLNTIQYWHKLEHFYPYILEEQRNKNIRTYNIKNVSDFPDFNAPDLPPSLEVRYYNVYLGLFKVDSALQILSNKLNINNHFHDEDNSVSCFCSFKLNNLGEFDKSSFKVSSFPWAIQRVNDNGIHIDEWDSSFQCFQRELFLRFLDSRKNLTYNILHSIINNIADEINWEIEFDNVWMRIDRIIGKTTNNYTTTEELNEIVEENEKIDELIKTNNLLNSFYVRDLEKVNNAILQNNYGKALNEFVDHSNDNQFNVETNNDLLFSIFNPQNMPMGKWPSGYPLRAMQQVAVNISMSETLHQGNIFSVNGPPGTGKTTLLRDIIAANIVNRAEKLIQFDTPNDAFTEPIGYIEYQKYTNEIRLLKDNLNCYGILVASNNNAAVRNITTELPLQDALSEQYQNSISYFSEISNLILTHKKTWGLCAAELGNKQNCKNFINEFWPLSKDNHDKFNFNQHLTNKVKSSTNHVTNWHKAKRNFINKYHEVELEYNNLQKCYDSIKETLLLSSQLRTKKEEYSSLETKKNELEKKLFQINTDITNLNLYIKHKEKQKKEMRQHITFFTIKYLFKHGIDNYLILEKEIQNLLSTKRKLENTILEIQLEIQDIEYNIDKQQIIIDTLSNTIQTNKKYIHTWKREHNCFIPTPEYICGLNNLSKKEIREKTQNQSPWNYCKIIQLREELFLEAMQLHKAFVENSSYMRDQLDAFGKLLRNQLTSEQAEKFATPLIQNFQLMVPVISTTFASVGTFLKHTGPNTFGLLLIDEAGQAFPQSAIGAIWRSTKCIVVGDPLQIEPVVTIHDRTIDYLKNIFSQNNLIASKDTSVQSLADLCNPYGAYRENASSQLWVGSPLLVHGRCQKKIFDIANRIAYNEKMIYGTKDCSNPICEWIQVVGNATYKHFVDKQADAILPLITEQFLEDWKQEKDIPSLFVITPFRSVKTKLIEYLVESDKIFNEILASNCIYDEDDRKKKIKEWGYKNIGTVHTFQGKEATTVILCLGADSGNKNNGAIQWASSKPNILNVAVTRAKENLYIVGDANKWAHQPYFETAYELCTKTT